MGGHGRLWHLGAAGALLLSLTSALRAAPITYDEGVSGDLSNSFFGSDGKPYLLGLLAPGVNTVRGRAGTPTGG